MTSRFAALMILIMMAASLMPINADAQTQSKTRLVSEIKNFPTITIPSVHDLPELITPKSQPEITAVPEVEALPIEVEAKVEAVQVKPAPAPMAKPKSALPPKTVGDARVYMHEPEIRAYVCPKIGAKACETFIAILKAENGTHECTRDNRGLNRNGSVDIGLAQINWKPGNPWHTFEQLQDCKYNLDVALDMYKRRGFQPWYAYTKGAYKKFLKPVPVAEVAAASIQ